MSRWVVLAVLVSGLVSVAACSKSAAPQSQDTGGKAAEPAAVAKDPGGMAAPDMGGNALGAKGEGAAPAGAGGVDPQKLAAQEGTLAIKVPADAKAGSEVTATIEVTPGSGYHINKEFPTKITLAKLDGVTFAKDQLVAGGADAAKGDADSFEEQKLQFSVKLTPTAGNHTVTGTFKFAVCDKDSCLPKKETLSIAVAAK